MTFSESEIEKAKELKRLRLKSRLPNFAWRVGMYVFDRHCPAGCASSEQEKVFVITHTDSITDKILDEAVWLPTFDDLLEISRELKVSFAQITDYLHRRRFADSNEREGVYQLLIERIR